MEKLNDENTELSVKKKSKDNKGHNKEVNNSNDNKEKIVSILKSKIYIISFLVSFLVIYIIMVFAKAEPFGDKSILIGDSMDQYMPFLVYLDLSLSLEI